MITTLHIKNIGIIEEITIDFNSNPSQDNTMLNYASTTVKSILSILSEMAISSDDKNAITDILNTITQFNDTFADTPEAVWLANNCYKYGSILRYPKGKSNETGYKYEPWHFRYIGNVELATKLYNNGDWITLEDYFGITSEYSD